MAFWWRVAGAGHEGGHAVRTARDPFITAGAGGRRLPTVRALGLLSLVLLLIGRRRSTSAPPISVTLLAQPAVGSLATTVGFTSDATNSPILRVRPTVR